MGSQQAQVGLNDSSNLKKRNAGRLNGPHFFLMFAS